MTKKRVSLTLDQEIVERIDKEASDRNLNRSQMVEKISEDYFKQRGLETVLILCGDPEARSLELYDGEPVLNHILDHLNSEDIEKAVLLIGKNREIKEKYGSSYKGVDLEYGDEGEPEGTAKAVKDVQEKVNETFGVLNGHVIADVDLQEMFNVHKEENSVATMALTAVENPSNYGVARLKGRSILGFEEKPEEGEEPSRLINAGTYVFSPEIFDRLSFDDLDELFKQLTDNRELSGYIYGGKWVEV